MADNNSRTEENMLDQDPPAPTSPPPAHDRASPHPSDGSVEDLITSPTIRTRSSATLSNENDDPSHQRLASITQESTAWNSPTSICLCQPDPKVPRPRNAFILYRQHHQARVVAQNPGLANPEISKVIGDHWRQSPPEVKQHWKSLAEEEKIRHQRQYPDYRYQPRRNGKNNSLSSGSNLSGGPADAENRPCVKCGGRSMNTATPTALSSAGYMASASVISPGTPYSATRPPSTPSTASSAKRFLQSAGSPPLTGSANSFAQRNRDLSNNITALGLATPRFKRPEDAAFPLSPDAKRRRVMGAPYIGAPRLPNGPPTPFGFPRRKESLPRLDLMNSPTFAMGPPPRPHPVAHQPDSSLTLPPLQNTPMSNESTQAKSVEAVVMSMQTLSKIRILAKASAPLSNPGPASPGFPTKGLIIAIDGQESVAVEQITAYLDTVLTSSYAVQEFQTPTVIDECREDASSSITTDSLEQYHTNITKYHYLSTQLKAYITTIPLTTTSATSSPAVSPKSLPAPKPQAAIQSTCTAPSSTIATASSTLAELPSASRSTTDFGPSKRSTTKGQIPIALVPSYQLTQTDAFASHVPIDDHWTPVEHWQWMASMWRGIVGPDITIAVKAVEEGSASEQPKGARGGWSGEKVDVRLEDFRAVIVRVEKGGKVAEGVLRRVGFEVEEYMRGRIGGV